MGLKTIYSALLRCKMEQPFYQLNTLPKYFHPKLIRFAFKISANEQLASDAVQNALIKMTGSIQRIHDPRAFKSWLYQAVRWQILDMLKTKKRDDNWLIETDINTVESDRVENHHLEENSAGLNKYLNELANIDKQAIHLFYLEEMSLQEISLILVIPVGTVKSRLNRARKQLKEKLENNQEI
jgi:RNA polymerase sigma-70 factor (ECF subfamily)